MLSTNKIDRDVALIVTADYRVDVEKFWCDANGNFSVWFKEEAGRDNIMDGKIKWALVPENITVGEFLSRIIGKEPSHLARKAVHDRSRSWHEARAACLTRRLRDLVC